MYIYIYTVYSLRYFTGSSRQYLKVCQRSSSSLRYFSTSGCVHYLADIRGHRPQFSTWVHQYLHLQHDNEIAPEFRMKKVYVFTHFRARFRMKRGCVELTCCICITR